MNSFLFLLLCSAVCLIDCHKDRNILSNEYKNKANAWDDIDNWRNQLRHEFVDRLQKLPESVRKSMVDNADKELKTGWEVLTVTQFLEYTIDGNRDHYEGKQRERRQRLESLALAELLTQNGQYLNHIGDGLWLILEESTWTWPAHIRYQRAGTGLPDPDQFIIDLRAGETSAFLAWLKFLLGDELRTMSPMITKRVDYELNRRIIQTYLSQDFKTQDFWMGLEGQRVNNWNTWINANVLMTILLNENGTERSQVLEKMMKSVDDWLNWYGDDGGCDEGPGYWSAAAGKFIEFLYYLTASSKNQLNWSSNQLMNNIGSYIYKVHIDDNYFVNFADASPRLVPDPTLVYRYGQVFNNSDMISFASYLYHLAGNESYLVSDDRSGDFQEFDHQMSAYPTLKDLTPKAPQPLESWFPDLQVLTLRSIEGSAKGLFLGAKAGNNGESHNHNDVGNFIVYVDGQPAIIDIGVETYTAKTFGKDRYTLWTMQSQWHNTPTINGVQQKESNATEHYQATNVSYTQESGSPVFEADIAGAYPTEAQVVSWVRKLSFDRTANSVNLTEDYKLEEFIKPFELNFITILDVDVSQQKSGTVVLKDSKTQLSMKFDPKLFDVRVDQHKNDDKKLLSEWGQRDHINRVVLIDKLSAIEGIHTIVFQM